MYARHGCLFPLAAVTLLTYVSSSLSHVSSAPSSPSDSSILNYLQQESAAVTAAQHSIQQFLLSKNIPVGLGPVASKAIRERASRQAAALSAEGSDDPTKFSNYKIAMSTAENDITCRISLARVPLGRKCVAPCGCAGSQEWVQFAELNRLRRLEPQQWRVCQTCRQPFDYSAVQMFGGVRGNLLTTLLDHMTVLRTLTAAVLVGVLTFFRASSILLRILTSRALWQLVTFLTFFFFFCI